VYAAASAIGLAAVLAASATAFMIVKLIGAAYLIYLGVMALWRSRRKPAGLSTPADPAPAIGVRAAYRQGLMSNLSNPKIALIFLTLIPQFVSPGEPALRTTAVLAAAFLAMAVVWWRIFSLAVGALGRVLAHDRIRTFIERLTGVVLIGLGLRVAFLDR
jgi:threonine/homoserine/homoserine lactone efflux protein